MEDLIRQLKQIYVLLDDSERRALRSVDVTPTQVGLLTVVSRSDAGQTISALAGELLCSRGNVTRLVQRMTERGLVAATGHVSDQRLVLVRLTDRGRLLLAQAQQALRTNAERLQEHFTAGRLEQLTELSAEFIVALEQELVQPPLETVTSAVLR